jgi:hypothetical protein
VIEATSGTEALELARRHLPDLILSDIHMPGGDGSTLLQNIRSDRELLLPKEGKAGLLSSLARQGRSWGFPVWLASQDADAFVTTGPHSTNFADLAGCGIHFSPDTLKDSEQKEILGSVLNHSLKQGEAALRLHKKLQTGPARQFWKTGGA